MTANVIAAMAYFATMILGLSARFLNRRFGYWHHIAFATCCITFAVAVVIDPSVRHIIPALALMMIPFTRPRHSRVHDLVAVLGAVGYALMLT